MENCSVPPALLLKAIGWGFDVQSFNPRNPRSALHCSPPECRHQSTSLRCKVIKGGAMQWRMQCSDCGLPIGKYAKKPEEPVPMFDEKLYEAGEGERDAARAIRAWAWTRYREIHAECTGMAVVADRSKYDAYMSSSEWRRKRDAVLRRANGMCEGCGERVAKQVHHVVYPEHLGTEMLWTLKAVCIQCHNACHPDKPPQRVLDHDGVDVPF
jgi:hypothetical protein